MKATILLIIFLFFTLLVNAQVSKTVELTAGSLAIELTTNELNTVTDLSLTGTIDARDFKTMRDDMPVLANLDMSEAQIIAYEGDEGPSEDTTAYAVDAIPRDAFHIENFGKTSLQSVLIPLTTKVIEPWAFSRCTSLTTFDLPPSVTTIQAFAFATCYTITSISIPESVETIESGAFAACSALTAISLPSSVDSIQPLTFASCEGLVSIDLPSTLTSIGDNAFRDCGSLRNITLPASLKTIGNLAFYLCHSLQSITFPEGLTLIGENAFNGCVSMQGILILPEGLSAINDGTFESCSSITTVTIPSSVDSIGDAAFLRCTSLKFVDLTTSIVYIGSYAFMECTNLIELFLPSSLKTLGRSAFSYCSLLGGKLIIPSQLTIIPKEAFNYCSSLTSLVIPSSVNSIGSNAFTSCSSLTSIEVHHLFPLSLYAAERVFQHVDKSSITLHVPFGTRERYATAYGWKDFGTIAEGTGGFQLNATSVKFTPEGGTDNSIEVTADFAWTATADQPWLTVSPSSGDDSQTLVITAEANTALSSRKGIVTLSAENISSQTIFVTQGSNTRVVSITPGSLANAMSPQEKQSVSSLTLTGSMDARDFRTIHNQMPLLEVLDITEITIEAYTDTTFGNHLTHPANAIPFAVHEWIDKRQTSYALSEHQKLEVIKLPRSLESMGYRAFFDCSSLTTVVMHSSVTEIGNEAFHYCSALTDINLPSSLTSIGEMAFKGCSNLPFIELPSSLTQIEYSTFLECRALKSIVIPSSITSIGESAFEGCSSLESVTIPSDITIIEVEAFMDCSSLTSVIIPSKVTLIDHNAFMGCSALESVSLPASLTAMRTDVFSDCISLNILYSYAVIPPNLDNDGGSGVFTNVDTENCLLYVPYGTKELYASAYQWEDFENIVEMGQFSLEVTTVTLGAWENSEVPVNLYSTVEWTATSDQEWLTVTPASGRGTQLLALIAKANSNNSNRTATVTVIATGIDTLTLSVTQYGLATGMKELEAGVQLSFYPNPFTSEMAVELANPSLKEVYVDIYSMSGQKVRSLAKALKGAHISLNWNGTNEQGMKVPHGMYLLKVNEQTKKVVFGK